MINSAGSVDNPIGGGKNITEMAALCSLKNAVVGECHKNGSKTLEQFLDMQAEKVLANKNLSSIKSKDDFCDQVKNKISDRLGEAFTKDAYTALSQGVLSTADHHGSVYCSQSFQGDILYYFLLKKLGFEENVVPYITGGQVELANVTFSRGMCRYNSKVKKECLPFFRKLDQNKMAMNAAPVNREMLDKFRKRFDDKVIDDICEKVYEAENVQKAASFAEQTTLIGAELFKHIFKEDNALIPAYLEVEELIRPLLIDELSKEDSILRRLLGEKSALKKLNEIMTSDGLPLAAQLFACSDEKGRKIFLLLDEDGMLTGSSMDGTEASFKADSESLAELLSRKTIFPGLFMAAFLLVFERGFTWMGGMFQALYLPEWKNAVCELLKSTGFSEEEAAIRPVDCSGYISGPMFALYKGDGFATTAGPVEMWEYSKGLGYIEKLIKNTTLWDSHLIGLSEMYPDLLNKSERTEGWYETIAEGLYERFTENYL